MKEEKNQGALSEKDTDKKIERQETNKKTERPEKDVNEKEQRQKEKKLKKLFDADKVYGAEKVTVKEDKPKIFEKGAEIEKEPRYSVYHDIGKRTDIKGAKPYISYDFGPGGPKKTVIMRKPGEKVGSPKDLIKKYKKQKRDVKKGKWFQKIPTDILFSPIGVVLFTYAIIMEIVDLIPLPFIDNLWELPFEIVFIILLMVFAKVSLKASIIPLLIERIPIINDILPTWVIRMFV